MHGGSAPQVKEAARLRILELVNPALATLGRALKVKKPDAQAIAAAKDILDRAGFKPVERQSHLVKSPKDMTADELREWANDLGADDSASDPR